MDAKRLFLGLFDQATTTASKIIMSVSPEEWVIEPPDYFGPGEQIVHVMQSEQFALNYVLTVARGEQVVLPAAFNSILAVYGEERHQALSKLNFDGARAKRRKYETLAVLQADWHAHRQRVREALAALPENTYDLPTSHPLVDFTGPLLEIAGTLFVEHLPYHMGELQQLLKLNGHKKPEFPFGTMPVAS